jgi:DNA-binding NarL/FixJ family response regulator
MQVVAEAWNGGEAMEKYVARPADIALMELGMLRSDGVETVMPICARVPVRVSVLTTCQG